MRVRIKTWLLAALGALTLGTLAGEAAAQCGTGCTPPPTPSCCTAPPTPSCCESPPAPPSPPSPPHSCCEAPPPPDYPGGGGGGNFNVNVNINANVNSNANTNTNSNINAGSTIRARGAGDVYVSGGGGAYFSVDQPYPTVIQGLNVEGGAAATQVIQQAVERSRWAFSRVVIQALCIDDRNIPHPASQVQPGREIAPGYNGELYRCIAGTRLQYTLAEFAEQISFDHGQTMSCQKGESLWYNEGAAAGGASQYAAAYAQAYAAQYGGQHGGAGGPAGGGIVECRPQLAERDCNERSLLRRYGAGVKILTLWREEIYTEYQEQVVEAAASMSMGYSLTLDGGVGGRVF